MGELAPWHQALFERLRCRMLWPQVVVLAGPQYTGKDDLVRSCVASLLCENEPSPCGTCSVCNLIEARVHPDVIEVALCEGAESRSIGVDAVRTVVEKVSLTASQARGRFVIFLHAEALTVGAANALLKSLEDPFGHITFFLLVTHVQDLLVTSGVRCGCTQPHK